VVEARILDASTTRSAPDAVPTLFASTRATRVVTPIEPIDIAPHDETAEPAHGDRSAWKWLAAVAALAVAVTVVAGLAWSFYRQATVAAERASEAQQHAQQIATAASERIEAARQDAAAQITLAHDAASKAQVTGDVLAASDLVRYNLVGGDPAARTLGQLLWSRSRGLVFTASRMPPPPQGFVYQLWLLTAGAPIGAGTVAPDASGRVTLATDSPPDAPRPIAGVRVTIEPAPGRPAPSGPVALAPVVLAPPQ
jgi:hypothetical protein